MYTQLSSPGRGAGGPSESGNNNFSSRKNTRGTLHNFNHTGSVASGATNEDVELRKEIYRMSEIEGWSKEKLFSMLQDPQKYKKSHRYILNKVSESLTH